MATNMKSVHSKQVALRFLSISLLCAPFSFKYMAVAVGPFGAFEIGRFWEVNGDIRKFTIQHGDIVHSLIITYIKGGIKKVSLTFGGPGEIREDEICLAKDEYLVTIKGWTTTWQSIEVVSSLTFITNKRPKGIGPYGKESGEEFSLPVKVGKSAGLFGFSGIHLYAIGIFLVPNQGTVELGPWGGGGGIPWATKDGGDIRSFQVASDGEVVVSITLNGEKFGGSGGTLSNPVQLASDEYLCSIEGAVGTHGDNIILQTISFVTNKKTYGPYGKAGEGAAHFGPPVKNGKIVGISGRQGTTGIEAIAFTVEPVPE